jgi:hypothetical protein
MGDYSDLTIVCGEQEFKAHKVIVCAYSDWFKNACKKNFIVSQFCLITLLRADKISLGGTIFSYLSS